MGIKNITKLLKKFNNIGISVKHISDYANKTIAIDFSNYAYKFVYHIKKHSYHKYHYIESMFNLVCTLRKYNITPVFIFDGEPPNEKHNELQRRNQERQKREEKKATIMKDIINIINVETQSDNNEIKFNGTIIDTISMITNNKYSGITINENDDEHLSKLISEAKKIDNQCLYVTEQHVKYCAALFRYLGVPYVYGGNEADDMCGFLHKKGYVDACMSDDTDMLAHGIKIVLRDYNFYTGNLHEYNLEGICQDLDLNYSQFLDMCILCGCDYCKIYGIGPNRSYNIIKKYGNIENSMEYIQKTFTLPNEFDYVKVRNIFLGKNAYEKLGLTEQHMSMKKPQYEKLIKFLKIVSNHEYTITDINDKIGVS